MKIFWTILGISGLAGCIYGIWFQPSDVIVKSLISLLLVVTLSSQLQKMWRGQDNE